MTEPAAVFPFPRVDHTTPPTPPCAVRGQLTGLTLQGLTATAQVQVSCEAAVHLGGLLFAEVTLVDPVSAEADSPLGAAVRAYLQALDARLPGEASAGERHALALLRSLSGGVSWTELVAAETAVQDEALNELTRENQALARALAEVKAQLGEARELVAAALVDATPAPKAELEPEAALEKGLGDGLQFEQSAAFRAALAARTPELEPGAPALRTGESYAATHPALHPAPQPPLNPNPAPQRQEPAASDNGALSVTWLVEKADTPPSGPAFLALETGWESGDLVAFSWVSEVGAASHFATLTAAEDAVAALPELPPVRYRTSASAPAGAGWLWDEHTTPAAAAPSTDTPNTDSHDADQAAANQATGV